MFDEMLLCELLLMKCREEVFLSFLTQPWLVLVFDSLSYLP